MAEIVCPYCRGEATVFEGGQLMVCCHCEGTGKVRGITVEEVLHYKPRFAIRKKYQKRKNNHKPGSSNG